MNRNGRILVLFAADSFCYGPAAIAIAVARALRESNKNIPWMLIAIGKSTALELFRTSDAFDQCLEYDWSSDAPLSQKFYTAFKSASAAVTVLDFDFARAIKGYGITVYCIDPLFWMWDQPPVGMQYCSRYFATRFPGMEGLLGRRIAATDQALKPEIVEPIRDNIALNEVSTAATDNTLLVNLGGVESPLGSNIPLAMAMCNCIVDVAKSIDVYDQVLICGGQSAVDRLGGNLTKRSKVTIVALPQREFLEAIARCKTLCTVPGLSIIYEALFFQTSTVILLPLNYSQHLQCQAYAELFPDVHVILWEQIPGYRTLEHHLPEPQGVRKALSLGVRFSADIEGLSAFRELIVRHLTHPSLSVLSATCGSRLCEGFADHCDGARQVAAHILSSCV